ncbi:MAG TPA: DUF192 domain-containing protein [Terriglobales bacterium]
MPAPAGQRYAYNRTSRAYLATDLMLADTHWTRLRGLMATDAEKFPQGSGLWIVPCRGVHTFGMRFAIDVVYLNAEQKVVYVQENLRPWRMAPVRWSAVSVVELPPGTIGQTQTGVGDVIDVGLNGNGVRA